MPKSVKDSHDVHHAAGKVRRRESYPSRTLCGAANAAYPLERGKRPDQNQHNLSWPRAHDPVSGLVPVGQFQFPGMTHRFIRASSRGRNRTKQARAQKRMHPRHTSRPIYRGYGMSGLCGRSMHLQVGISSGRARKGTRIRQKKREFRGTCRDERRPDAKRPMAQNVF